MEIVAILADISQPGSRPQNTGLSPWATYGLSSLPVTPDWDQTQPPRLAETSLTTGDTVRKLFTAAPTGPLPGTQKMKQFHKTQHKTQQSQ